MASAEVLKDLLHGGDFRVLRADYCRTICSPHLLFGSVGFSSAAWAFPRQRELPYR